VSGGLGLGLRLGDVRIDLAATLRPTWSDGDWLDAARWRQPDVRLALRLVLLEHIDLGFAVTAVPDGAWGEFDWNYYPSRRLGLLAAVGGGSGAIDPGPTDEQRLFARVGFSWWASRRFGLTAFFAPVWRVTDAGAGLLDVHFLVELHTRL
jgi:hypothetical protein